MSGLIHSKIPAHTCKHHIWQSWRHYGAMTPESGCRLNGGKSDCKYHNAARCPNYQPKEENGNG